MDILLLCSCEKYKEISRRYEEITQNLRPLLPPLEGAGFMYRGAFLHISQVCGKYEGISRKSEEVCIGTMEKAPLYSLRALEKFRVLSPV